MLKFKIDAREVRQAVEHVRGLGEKLGDAVERHANTEGLLMEKEIKQSLSIGGQKTGPKGGRIVVHSLPGQPPRLQTGNLRSTIGFDVTVNKSAGTFSMRLGAIRGGGKEAQHAEPLELGTSRMAPRPYLVPVVIRHLQKWGVSMKPFLEQVVKQRLEYRLGVK